MNEYLSRKNLILRPAIRLGMILLAMAAGGQAASVPGRTGRRGERDADFETLIEFLDQ